MAVTALFCFSGAHRVGDERGESLAGERRRGNRLLRVVKPIAIGILRADQYGTRRSRRGHAMTSHRAVDTQHINVVAQNLKVVAGVILCEESFVVQHGLARISSHLQMAAEASGRPRGMAGITSNAAVRIVEGGGLVRYFPHPHPTPPPPPSPPSA